MTNDFKIYYGQLFERDIKSVIREVESYSDEALLWKTAVGINNSGGNLAVHLAGNLRHFIGHVIGGSNYKRDREREFAVKNIPRAEIISGLDFAINDVKSGLAGISEKELDQEFPIKVFGEISTRHFIAHIHGHLNYHLGQINYHRRLCDK